MPSFVLSLNVCLTPNDRMANTTAGASIVQQNAQSELLANSSIYVSLDIVLWVLSSNVTSSKPIEFGKGYIIYIGAAVGGSVRFSNFQAVE